MLASPGAQPSSSLAIVQLAATASMATLRAVAVRSAVSTFDPASTHKDLGTREEEACTGSPVSRLVTALCVGTRLVWLTQSLSPCETEPQAILL
jgi:hypothetical protein